MKTLFSLIFALVLLVGFGLTACQRSDTVEAARETVAGRDRSIRVTTDEKDFIDYAAEMHAGEIKLAQLAKQKSSRQDIKEYADVVIASHTDALKELSDRTGQEQDRTPETTTASRDTQNHAKYLSPLSGAKFDQEFIALMIADHKNAASTFKDQASVTQNQELTGYIKEVLPILDNDLSKAEKIGKTLGVARAR
jgi:putative membrane protein